MKIEENTKAELSYLKKEIEEKKEKALDLPFV